MKHLLDTRVGPVPGDDPDGRRRHDRRRRRLDRLRRRAAASSASARARPAPIPGPAAYGRGGTEATATDAMVNLGWLLPGDVPRRRDGAARRPRARRRSRTGPASALGMSVEEASMGAVQILTHSMVQSIEENSVRKGYDPRDFALVAEGGAGPLFAAQIALEVGTPWVVVPNYPGVTAALGLLATDMVYEYVSTVYAAALEARRRARSQARVRGARGAGARPARGGRHPGRPDPDPARRRLPLPRPGLRAARRRRLGRRSTTPGSRRCAATSTTSTSASTRAASRTRTSRSRTSACAGSA